MLLAEGGQSLTSIVIDPEATKVEKFAAEEMQRYLTMITGGSFAVRRCATLPAGPVVVVARATSALGRMTCPTGRPDEPESYLVAVSSEQIRLIGADDRGTLYAVYSFLEEDCGVFWLAPSTGQEVVPNRPTLALPEMSRRGRPAWPIRMLAPMSKTTDNVDVFTQYIDFGAKLRLNRFLLFAGHFGRGRAPEPWDEVRTELLPEFEKRGIELDIGHHCWSFFVDANTYYAEHPEWFSLVDGMRVPDRQLCLAAEGVLEQFEKNVRAYLRSHPEIRVLSLFPNDGGRAFCECEYCQRFEQEEAALAVVNRIALALQSEFPQVQFAHLTYNAWSDMAPARIEPAPNVILYFGAWQHCLAHGFYSPHCTLNRPLRVALEGWRRTWPNEIVIYDFYTSTNHSTNALLPYVYSMAENARELRARGFEGFQTTWTQVQNWFTYALNLWLFGKLTWNPERDGEALLDEWVSAAYPHTGKDIIRIYRALADIARYEAHYLRSDFIGCSLLPELARRTMLGSVDELDDILTTLAGCESLLEQMGRGDVSEREADYLRRLAIAVQYLSIRSRYVQGVVGAQAALTEAQRKGPPPGFRAKALRSAREWMGQIAAAENEAVAMLDGLGDQVDGILDNQYVRNWASQPESSGLVAPRPVLEERIRELEKES